MNGITESIDLILGSKRKKLYKFIGNIQSGIAKLKDPLSVGLTASLM